MGLRQLQRAFADQLLADTPPDARPFRGRGAAGVAVYRNAYRVQLVGALRDTFETTHAWLGDTAFESVAQAYVDGHPPQSWTLADYGDRFADTLTELFPDDGEAAELAWLDWSLRRAFRGPDAPVLAADHLAQVDWTRVGLRFVPTMSLGVLVWNSAAIWSALAEGRRPPSAERLARSMGVRVWRNGLSPRFRSIGPSELEALEAASGGDSFASICARLAASTSEAQAAAEAATFLADWVRDGLIAGIVTPAETVG